jgi:hypothetical protein
VCKDFDIEITIGSIAGLVPAMMARFRWSPH